MSPAHMDWSSYYPAFVAPEVAATEEAPGTDDDVEIKDPAVKRLTKDVEVADIGCGFGGLLVALGPRMPDTLLLGTSRNTDGRTAVD